jgi:cell shape-determining protein MreC
MKKTFLARRNALLTSTDVSWGAGAVVFALLALLLRLAAPNLFWQATAPAFRVSDYLAETSHAVFSSFGDTAALALRNERLLAENAALVRENQALQEKAASLGVLSKAQGAESLIAGVIARPPASPYDTLVLSLGSDAGVAVGQEAFGAGGVPIGIVSAVLAGFSRVTLFSSPEVALDAWVGEMNLPLTVYGAGAGAMRASVARSAGVLEGDTVFAPGPGALPIGSVVRVDSDASSPTAVLQIQLAIHPFSITWVELRDTGPSFAASLSWATSTP